jgi:hypothetical protein
VSSSPESVPATSAAPALGVPPDAIVEELDRGLAAGEFRDYASLKQWLERNRCHIRHAAAPRRSKLERRLHTIRLATEHARALVGGEDDRLSEALVRLVQQHLFEILVELKPGELTEINLSALGHVVAEMARASLMQKKWAEESQARLEQKVNRAKNKVVNAARNAAEGGGFTPEAEERIRQALMAITK